MADRKSSAEELQDKWAVLPDGLQQQVLDFMEFLLDKHQLFRPCVGSDNVPAEGGGIAARTEEQQPRVLGLNQGEIWMSEDFNEPLPDDFWLGKV